MYVRGRELTGEIDMLVRRYLRNDAMGEALDGETGPELRRILADAIMYDYREGLMHTGRAHGMDAMILVLHRVLDGWNISLVARYKLISDAILAYRRLEVRADAHEDEGTGAKSESMTDVPLSKAVYADGLCELIRRNAGRTMGNGSVKR